MVSVRHRREVRGLRTTKRSGLVVRFAGACLFVFLAVGITAHIVVRGQVRDEDQSNAQSHAVFVTNSLLNPLFRGGVDLREPLSASVASSLREHVRPLFGDQIMRLKIWRSDG